MTLFRLDQVVCPPHQQQTTSSMWPAVGDLAAMTQSCQDCGSRLNQALQEADYGPFTVLALPDLNENAQDWSVAIHEAGHAAVAAATGRQIVSAEAYPWNSDHAAQHGYTGRVLAVDELNETTALDYVASLYAGQEATVRWLAETGQDTPATVLGARYISYDDNVRAAEISQRYAVDIDAGLAVCREILDDRWTQTRSLAGDLLTQTYLDGPEVHQTLNERDDTDTY